MDFFEPFWYIDLLRANFNTLVTSHTGITPAAIQQRIYITAPTPTPPATQPIAESTKAY
jgi:hypothetical protein